MSLAIEGPYRPLWSTAILAELEHHEIRKLMERGEEADIAAARWRQPATADLRGGDNLAQRIQQQLRAASVRPVCGRVRRLLNDARPPAHLRRPGHTTTRLVPARRRTILGPHLTEQFGGGTICTWNPHIP